MPLLSCDRVSTVFGHVPPLDRVALQIPVAPIPVVSGFSSR